LGFATAGVERMIFEDDGRAEFRFAVNAVDGSRPSPSYAFTSSGDTGLYRDGNGSVSVTTDAVDVAKFTTTALEFKHPMHSALTNSDVVSLPSYSWKDDPDTGIFNENDDNTISFGTGGVLAMTINSSQNVVVAGDLTVDDEAYTSAGWDGDLSVPTKNAVRDKIESLGTGQGGNNFYGGITVEGSGTFSGIVRGEAFYLGYHNSGISTGPSGNMVIDSGSNNVHIIPNAELEVIGDITSKGTRWISRTSSANDSWFSVTYGNGLFVAVHNIGSSNRVMTSPDGIGWTSRTTPVNNNWNSVTYGNGLFVSVSITGTDDRVMTSPDGITWTSRTSATNNN
ncbi:hypothetical protein LCGC14_3139730, partial [marine sediment metagenome]